MHGMQATPPALRKKASRLVGGKCTLLARIDAYGQDPTGSAGANMKVHCPSICDTLSLSLVGPIVKNIGAHERKSACVLHSPSVASVGHAGLDAGGDEQEDREVAGEGPGQAGARAAGAGHGAQEAARRQARPQVQGALRPHRHQEGAPALLPLHPPCLHAVPVTLHACKPPPHQHGCQA